MKAHQVNNVSRRGGAVIIVVISLMTTLAFLGLFFYSWTSQEQISASNFADPVDVTPDLDPQPIVNVGLEQLILGTRGQYEDSALWGNKYAMVPNMIGRMDLSLKIADDSHLFNGQGIRVDAADVNTFDLYYDDDNTADADQSDFVLNFSKSAHDGDNFFNLPSTHSQKALGDAAAQWQPDAGYTYPDLNSMFLCLETFDENGDRVIIPSFLRPAYHPGLRGASGDFSALATAAQQQRFLGPNRGNVNASDTGYRRFLTTPTPAQSGDRERVLDAFEFDPDPDGDGTAWEMGGWDGSNSYDLPIDADGDGIHDAILMDLDYSIISLIDGRQVVPLYAFKVIDADALLNLNAHGSMAIHQLLQQLGEGSPGKIVDDSLLMTRSNLGYTRAEINPGYALANNPADKSLSNADAFRQHYGFYQDNTLTFDRVQMANTELAFLLSGRPQFTSNGNPIGDPQDDLPGRYGEESLLRNSGRFAMPGVTGTDDDFDANASSGSYTKRTDREARNGGAAYADNTYTTPVIVPSATHPLDTRGMGDWLDGSLSVGATQKRNGTVNLDVAAAPTTNPVNWPQYKQTDLSAFRPNDLLLWQNLGGGLQNSPHAPFIHNGTGRDLLFDDDDELVLNRNFAANGDAPFSPSELAALHLSPADWSSLGAYSRVRTLAPFNFEYYDNAIDVRKMFTTDSRDRMEFSLAYSFQRPWETNGGTEFPTNYNVIGTTFDPFREALRNLISIDFTNSGPRSNPQQRLDLNRLLVNFDEKGNAVYRHLMPHAVFQAADSPLYSSDPNEGVLHSNLDGSLRPLSHNPEVYSKSFYDEDSDSVDVLDPQIPAIGIEFNAVPLSSVDPSNYAGRLAQEAWARHDRQRMARDIYVLMYTLCLPDNFNPKTDDPSSNANIESQIQQIAQFAVNYVDAMDRDDVITKFEYDKNLSDGWGNDLESVNGVEHQQLTFSEGMWIVCDDAQDYDKTPFTDSDQLYQFLHMELRNVYPFDVGLSEGTWRLSVNVENPSGGIVTRYVTFESGLSVPAGENFLIGITDQPNNVPSDFYVDHAADTGNQSYELVSPKGTVDWEDGTPQPASNFDLDLNTTAQASEHDMPTHLLENMQDNEGLTLILERRRNLHAIGIGEGDEWIEVDRHHVVRNSFNPSGDTQANALTALEKIVSQERLEPFQPYQDDHADGNAINHSMSVVPAEKSAGNYIWVQDENAGIFAPYEIWQMHFDRDFHSKFELNSIYLVDPTTLISDGTTIVVGTSSGGGPPGGGPPGGGPPGGFPSGPPGGTPPGLGANGPPGLAKKQSYEIDHLAGSMFMDPTGRSRIDNTNDNRWYRLFEFIDVPSRSSQVVYDGLGVVRHDHAVVNLNTIRNEQVYAGLIDDVYQLNPDPTNGYTRDSYDNGPVYYRNWYDQMRMTRDGIATPATTGMPPEPDVPGLPTAQPFRPASYLNPGRSIPVTSADLDDNPLQDTIMRFHMDDSGTTQTPQGWTSTNTIAALEGLGILEARATAEVFASNQEVDMHTRYRLLGKVDNHTTCRSNVFLVWAYVQFHDAHEPSAGVVQIGARNEDIPPIRQFVVVDRTRLEEAWDPVTETFDFRKFIIHRQMLP